MKPLLSRFGISLRRRALARPKPLRIIERLAQRYGFEWQEPTWFGEMDGWVVQLTGVDARIQVALLMPDDQPEDFAFVLDHHEPVPPWPFPAEDLVITGDARFDAEAHVVGRPIDALARLDRRTRESLRAWPGLTLHRGRVTVTMPTARLADQFMGTIRALRHTVGRLCLTADDVQSTLESRLDEGREPVAHRQAILQALARAGRLQEGLMYRLLEHPAPALRLEAATLAPPQDQRAADTLWAMTLDPQVPPAWRTEAVHRWMARAPADDRRRGLDALGQAQHPEVVAATCFWWGQQTDARETLAGWLKHSSPDVRAAAMVALSSMTTVLKPQEEALIIRMLHTYPEATVVQAALQALRVGGTRSLEAVRSFLGSGSVSPEARRAARATLKALQTRRRTLPGRVAIVDDSGEGQLSIADGRAA